MTTDSDDCLAARYRKEYEEDTFKWLHGRFLCVNERIKDRSEWQANQAKEFTQNAAESVARTLTQTRYTLTLWLGLIAIVALVSAGLWVGAGVVVLILAWVWFRNLMTAKMLWRLDRFRDDFRKLWEIAEYGGPGGYMLEEDKDFLQKCRDSILFPLSVAPLSREIPYLERIEILYREYCKIHTDGVFPECELCAARRRVREHVDGVLSKFEGQIEAARMALIARIDGRDSEAAIHTTNFLEEYRKWERWLYLPPPDLPVPEFESNKKLLDTLREQENWTFEEADRVREICRADRAERGEGAEQMFDVLTSEMEAAAKRCEVEEIWRFYDTNKNWLFEESRSTLRMEYTLKNIRRAFGRHNPETTVRELVYSDGSLRAGLLNDLKPLKSYGLDLEMVRRELRAAGKLVEKARSERREELQVFAAAGVFFELEKAEDSRREKAAPRT